MGSGFSLEGNTKNNTPPYSCAPVVTISLRNLTAFQVLLTFVDLFRLRQNGMFSIKQSQTVPLHVGYQYLPTQSVISTLQKLKTQSINKKIIDTETDTLLPCISDNNEFRRGVNSVR